MDIPYGFDCYTFQKEEIKFFERDLIHVRESILPGANFASKMSRVEMVQQAESSNSMRTSHRRRRRPRRQSSTLGELDHVKFTRKNEDYPREQVFALGKASRVNLSEIDRRIFCGIKIQLGIGVVTSFLRKGLQYKAPIRGRSELVNGTWTGIMRGLTVKKESPLSYDIAFGNFLAWDEEFPYIKFGPFFAIESKLVMLTGSSRRIEASSFGTNITREIWLPILASLLVLSILASLRIRWQSGKNRSSSSIILATCRKVQVRENLDEPINRASLVFIISNFFFIYIAMLLNKPSLEFDELIWPRVEQHNPIRERQHQTS